MDLLQQQGLSVNSGFLARVESAMVHTAIAATTETTDDVQTLTITGTAQSGSFSLNVPWNNGQTTTPPIPWNAAASDVQAALLSVPNMGMSGVVCTSGPLPGTGIAITAQGPNAGQSKQPFTVGVNQLFGTGTPTPVVTHTTPGAAAVYHGQRAVLAKQILLNTSGYVGQFAKATADNATVQNDFNALSGNLLASGVTEAQVKNDVQFQVNSVYNSFI